MAILASSTIAVIMCWVMRWEYMDPETIKQQLAMQNNNASCTSVLTCVEPSLRDV